MPRKQPLARLRKQIRAVETAADGGTPLRVDAVLEEFNAALEELRLSEAETTAANSELARAYARAEEAHARYRELFENAPDAYIVTDGEHRIVEANRAAVGLTGIGRSGLIGQRITKIVPAADANRFEDRLDALAAQSEPQRWEPRLWPRDGRPTFAEIVVSPLCDPDGVVRKRRWILRDVTERKMAEAELGRSRAELRALATELSLAEERERRRLATDLHEQVGQSLVLAKMRLAQRTQRGPNGSDLEAAKGLLDDALRATRSLTFDLSPPVLHEMGLVPALEWMVEDFEARHGLHVRLRVGTAPMPLQPEMAVVLYRGVREALVNVVKHAGTRSAQVLVSRVEGEIEVEVTDRGRGFDPNRVGRNAGFGLFSLRERLAHMGGSATITPGARAGTRVVLRAPLALKDPAIVWGRRPHGDSNPAGR